MPGVAGRVFRRRVDDLPPLRPEGTVRADEPGNVDRAFGEVGG
jgi:hypothetical protein